MQIINDNRAKEKAKKDNPSAGEAGYAAASPAFSIAGALHNPKKIVYCRRRGNAYANGDLRTVGGI